MRPLLALPLLMLAACATAQPADPPTMPPPAAPAAAAAPAAPAPPAPPDTALTEAERTIRDLVAGDGVYVVHFWAPWCDNSMNELAQGWYEVVEDNPEVGFAFVTVWNDGAPGEEALARYAVPERVARLVVPGPRPERADRRMTFLDLPVNWIPTTWVFNRNGRLAYAFNFGEATMTQLQQAIDAARRDW
jgi:thiol-disulfide isomerase/thioredoxin